MGETKEYIITAESSSEIKQEAIDLLSKVGAEILHFDKIELMPLTEFDEPQTTRTFSVMNGSVTVTEDVFLEFVELYFKARQEYLETERAVAVEEGKRACEIMQESWEKADYEWPLKNN